MKKMAMAPLAVVALLVAACSSGDPEEQAPMELTAGGGDTMASCLAFDPNVLADMPVAFEGTAKNVEGERVTLEVDRWFTGGDADEVVLVAPAGLEALIGGINFEEGEQYLISATDGQVNYCGYSGPATADLEAGFEQAFGS
ncbi:MAG: hypothetical protein H6674_02080 [Dehalococcoidia bacterium]|nr:hypothetical protein [Dehalococcoidia bacterium]